jgi:hypothetical protein
MMTRQARRSGLVMGFDTHMIAGSRACSTSTQPIHPTITSQTNPHYAEALGGPPAVGRGSRLSQPRVCQIDGLVDAASPLRQGGPQS